MAEARTYANPVHPNYLGDPFVLKWNGEYYAYGTRTTGDCTMPLLHSRDLVSWTELGDALDSLELPVECYWAPEVAYHNGVFYLYYSAGGSEGEGHQLRVATAAHPAGPFRDQGRVLTPDEPFSIDAHPFRDDDGQWYLFYCRDFLEGERPGTGIVANRLENMVSLVGEPTTIVRAHAEWNLFMRQREWYGRVWDWYTIEGAFAYKHDGRYYCIYSGGAWKEPNYGVGFVVAEHPLGPYRVAGSHAEADLLRTVPGQVIGPGHASLIVAPDNLTSYLVYHAWDPAHTGRLMRIDALEWTEDGPRCAGPTLDPQPAPPMPLLRELFDGPDGSPIDGRTWRVESGTWRVHRGEATQHTSQEEARALAALPDGSAYLYEANVRCTQPVDGSGEYGIYAWYAGPSSFAELVLRPGQPEMIWRCCVDGRDVEREAVSLAPLGAGFRYDVYHQIILTRRGATAELRVDGVPLAPVLALPHLPGTVGLFTRDTTTAFDGISLTRLDEG